MRIPKSAIVSLSRTTTLSHVLILGIVAYLQFAGAHTTQAQSSSIDELLNAPPSVAGDATIDPKTEPLTQPLGQQKQPALDRARVNSIKDRIQLLSTLLSDEADGSNNQSNSNSNGTPIEKQTAPTLNPTSPQPSPNNDTNDTPPDEPSIKAPSTTPKITLVGAKISEPVNTLELGYSLYRTGNYEAAEKNFVQLLELKPETSEAAWLHCMIGCCQSLQNQFTAADVSFRKCINLRKSPHFTAKYCEWKIRYLNARSKRSQTLKDIETEFNSITTGE